MIVEDSQELMVLETFKASLRYQRFEDLVGDPQLLGWASLLLLWELDFQHKKLKISNFYLSPENITLSFDG
jgi:hypothetical protein